MRQYPDKSKEADQEKDKREEVLARCGNCLDCLCNSKDDLKDVKHDPNRKKIR